MGPFLPLGVPDSGFFFFLPAGGVLGSILTFLSGGDSVSSSPASRLLVSGGRAGAAEVPLVGLVLRDDKGPPPRMVMYDDDGRKKKNGTEGWEGLDKELTSTNRSKVDDEYGKGLEAHAKQL